jgi:hypothetical protein
MHPDLVRLQRTLIGLSEALRKKLPSAEDQQQRDAILLEISEVFHRSVLVGNLLFHLVTTEMATRIQGASRAVDELKQALKTIRTIKDIVDGVTTLLVLVDRALDVLKKVPL